MFRFQKHNKVSWQIGKLFSVMALLMTKTKRFSDADIAYEDLIGHFRPIRAALTSNEAPKIVGLILPLIIRENRQPLPMINGVPFPLVRNIPGVDTILTMRDHLSKVAEDLKRLKRMQSLKILLGRKKRFRRLAFSKSSSKLFIEILCSKSKKRLERM